MSLFKDQVELQRKKRDGLGHCPQQREPVLGIPLWDPWALKKKSQGTITIPFFLPFPFFFQRHALVSNLSLFIYLFEHLGATRPLRSFGRVSREFWTRNTRLNYPRCFFPPEVVFVSTKRRASLPVCPHSNCPTKRAREQIYKPKLTPWWRSRAADLYRGTSNDHIVLKTYAFLQCMLDFGGMAWFYTNTSASKVQQIMMLLMEQIDHIP